MELPFNERGVSVTRTALSVAGQVFPLRDIEDLRVVTVERNRTVPWALSLIGVAGLVAGAWFGYAAALVCGVMLAVVGWLAWITQDVTYQLIVVTGGGTHEEREALSSLERAFVERVAGVVRDAMGAVKGDAASRAAP